MENLFRFFVLFLISRIVVTLPCPLKYDNECDCKIGFANQDFELNCPGPKKLDYFRSYSLPFDYFRLSFKPEKYVQIQCFESPDWSNFDYNIRSEVGDAAHFILKNCSFNTSTILSEIAKLTGAETAEILSIQENFETEIVLSKTNFIGFFNVRQLLITQNYKLTNLSNDLLEYLPKLINVDLSRNGLKMIPKKIFWNVPELKTISLSVNFIKYIETQIFKNLPKLTYLSLSANQIVEIKPHTFDGLNSLETLMLRENNLMSLPKDIFGKLIKLKVVDLMNNSIHSIPTGLFEQNVNIGKILLKCNLLETLPNEVFRNLINLKKLVLAENKCESLPPDLFFGLISLEILDLGMNSLHSLPAKIFDGLINLKTLRLGHNQLTTISRSLLKGLRSLEKLYVNFNNIETIEMGAFENLVNLRKIKLAHNKISHLGGMHDSDFGSMSVFSQCDALEELYLSHNNISEIYADWMILPPSQFEFLDLSHNRISSLSVEMLNLKHTEKFRLGLSNNYIRRFNLQGLERRFEQEYRSHAKMDISDNPIDCNCLIYDFLRYLDGSLSKNDSNFLDIHIGNLQCANPEEYRGTFLSQLKSKDFQCDARLYESVIKCPESCNTKINIHEKRIIIDCANRNLTEAPRELCNFSSGVEFVIELNLRNNLLKEIPNLNRTNFDKVKKLLLSGNNISSISKDALSPKLEVLELRDNAFTKLTSDEINQVMNSSLKNISLSGNPWKCNSETRNFIDFVQNNEREIISDSLEITCHNSKKNVKSMSVIELTPDNFSQMLCIIPQNYLMQVWKQTCGNPNFTLS